METGRVWERVRGWWGEEGVGTDLGRAFRATIAVMVPVGLGLAGWPSGKRAGLMLIAAIAGQGIAMAQIRGAYLLRAVVLVGFSGLVVGAVALGAWASRFHGAAGVWVAVGATVVIALNNGLWRHLSSEFGPSVAASVGLLFYIELLRAGGDVRGQAWAALVGVGWGFLLQVGTWPVRAEHPLRRAVGDALLATGDLVVELARKVEGESEEARAGRLAGAEGDWRELMDRAYAALDAAGARRGRGKEIVKRLAALNLAGAHVGTLARAVVTGLEGVKLSRPEEAAWEAAMEGVRVAMRGVAVGAVSRQAGAVGAAEVRLRRAEGLLVALGEMVGRETRAGVVVRRFQSHLRDTGYLLREAVGARGVRAAYPVELFDVAVWRLRLAAAGVNTTTHVDPAIVKFTARLGVLLVLSTVVVKTVPWAHAYWLPFTMIVVLQPDYGSTRKKAAQRLGGTALGSVLATGVLMLRLPHAAVMLGATAMSFVFVFFLRRNYGVAVVFITVYVMLMFEARSPVTVGLAVERVGLTVAGGVVALVAAVVFWPEWERRRVAGNVARALRANSLYLRVMADKLRNGGGVDEEVLNVKRVAETAGRGAVASVRRLSADPESQRGGTEWAAVIANGNARVTRGLNEVYVHLGEGKLGEAVMGFAERAAGVMEGVAGVLEGTAGAVEALGRARAGMQGVEVSGDGEGAARWVAEELGKVGAEVGAMGVVAELTLGFSC